MEKNDVIPIQFFVNGEQVQRKVSPDMNLMTFLRREMNLTGTKNGCETGHCGSCTVIVDGVARRACLLKMKRMEGVRVETIEGLSKEGTLHPLQQAFIETGAVQCGFCTPGMIMNAYGLLLEDPRPSREKVVDAMEGNLCRCSAYKRILEAIESVASSNGGRS
jgi:aerobic-type carbon monoxide dehydrogenase small subunit (CoxS/CutS family)